MGVLTSTVLSINKYTPNNFINKKVMSSRIKYIKILSFLEEDYSMKKDIIRYYSIAHK